MRSTAQSFEVAVEKKFGALLGHHDFTLRSSDSGKDSFAVLFRCGDRYVSVSGTLHPHDYPYYFSVAMGEGRDEWPERDWNAAALWRVVQAAAPEEEAEHSGLFEIHPKITPEEINQKIDTCVALMGKYGADFLAGDLGAFRRARAAQNREREPYKIFTPKKGGGYVQTYDEESRRLKERFSK